MMEVGRGSLPNWADRSVVRDISGSSAQLLGGKAVDIERHALRMGCFLRARTIGQYHTVRRVEIISGCVHLFVGKPGIAGMNDQSHGSI
jgi:hypothetical protein